MSSDLICSMYTDIESPDNFNEFDQYREQQREKDLYTNKKETKYKRSYAKNLQYSDATKIEIAYQVNVHADKIRDVADKYKVNYSSVKKTLKQNKFKKGKRFKHYRGYMDLNCPILQEVKEDRDNINTPDQCQLFLYQDWESNSLSVFNKMDNKYPFMKNKHKKEARDLLDEWQKTPLANI